MMLSCELCFLLLLFALHPVAKAPTYLRDRAAIVEILLFLRPLNTDKLDYQHGPPLPK